MTTTQLIRARNTTVFAEMLAALAASDDSDASQDDRDDAEIRLDCCLALLRERGIQITLEGVDMEEDEARTDGETDDEDDDE
jgi:hypothetical protein